METVRDFMFLGSRITVYGECSHEIKRCLLLGRKAMTNPDSILKSRDGTLPIKIRIVKAMVYPVVMYRCDHKEGWVPKSWYFRTAGEDSWESWTARKSSQSILNKGNQPWIFIGRTDAEAEAPILCHLMGRANSLEKTLMLEKTESSRRRGWQRKKWLDDIIQWTWIWANSRRRWRTEKPGLLQSMGSQRVPQDWVTEQQQQYLLQKN